MASDSEEGPDFASGVSPSAGLRERPLRGHVGGEPAILAQTGDEFFVVGAECTHYHGPLGEGIVVGDTVRCPWHHACFSLRSGRALHAPAFDALKRWRTELVDGRIYARAPIADDVTTPIETPDAPRKVVIVGAGAAGFACAHKLRMEGYNGFIDLVGADPAAPYDRPNLSKDYLAGQAPPEWMPLRDPAWYRDNGVRLRLGRSVEAIDIADKSVALDDGVTLSYDALLLATGASPVRLTTPGADAPNVFYLRSLADSDRLIAACGAARRALVVGASFIGLEVAAALRKRGLDVHVVAPDSIPMGRILGPDIGRYVHQLHAEHGVIFHLDDLVTEFGAGAATLRSGATIEADIVAIGVGVTPNLSLAELAGLEVDRGVIVDAYLQTSAPGVFAAGDIARWPDKISCEPIRVEHWAVAERHGQTVALNMLGRKLAFDAAPFFWSQHYDRVINYVGHAATWDRIDLSGDPAVNDCIARYYKGDKLLAVATLGREHDSLRAEAAFEASIGALAPQQAG